MIWVFVQRLGGQLVAAAVFALLALFLGPREYGIVGMAGVWIGFISAFAEWGFGSALIQRREIDERHFSTVFMLNIVMGAVLTAAGVGLSYVAAAFFKNPEVQPVMAALSVAFLASSFSVTQVALARREMRFRQLAIRDMTASTVGGVAAVTMASMGYGVWSLVAQQLVSAFIGTVLLWGLSTWRPRLRDFSRSHLAELWPYSSRVFAFSVVKGFTDDADTLIIGYFLGPVALGLYAFALKLMVPLAQLASAVGLYLFPKFSLMQDDRGAVHDAYLIVLKAIGGLALPYALFVTLVSPVAISTIWGEKWLDAIPLVQILAVVGVIKAMVSPMGHLMKSLDRPGWLFKWSLFVTVDVALFMLIGSLFSINGAALGAATAWIAATPVMYVLVRRLIRIGAREFVSAQRSSGLMCALAGITYWLVTLLPFDQPVVLSGIGFLVAAVVYSAGMWFVERDFIDYAIRRLFRP